MKLRAEKKFTDKITNEKYFIGDILDVTDERGTELLKNKEGLVSRLEADTAPQKRTYKKRVQENGNCK